MRHISMTPFGRQPVTAGLLATHALAEAEAPSTSPDKWALLRELTAARLQFAVSDRDLAVLSALLSFHPGKILADDDKLIVFPSNAALSDRAHGMAESTLRRHLAALVRAGLILRRDSPNGKRYATRRTGGAFDLVFGFDLRPLLVRSPEIAAAAAEARALAQTLRRLREAVVLRLRDGAKLLGWLAEHQPLAVESYHLRLAALQRQLRRKLDADMIEGMAVEADSLFDDIRSQIPVFAEELHANDSEYERHKQNSNSLILESEPCQERQERGGEVSTSLPLGIVLKAAPDIRDYAPDGIRSWRDLVAVADVVRPMLGVSPDAWARACQIMGAETAAIVLCCILQRVTEISRPGGYLRALTDKAEAGGFSPGPMVMALIRAENAQVS
ncbi:plasmid replication protein RepC [Paracoccus aminophilus]|uniref:Replication protein C n=1 Tax=Paracoccus aminophilus JCM 7686 TaxID=1367847 RepID=S5XZH4_PARAH|nr:plasmid replication protein RepC [Paracoccus aminophilus]AGT10692.1 replication protein C [Paracoccus aminophilus JCM 7686]